MRRILFTAAVEEELKCAKILFENRDLEIDYSITGVGAVETVYQLSKLLSDSKSKYDLVVNIGIAGTFDKKYPLGSVVRVEREVFGDFGVESSDGDFQSWFEYGLVNPNHHPYTEGALIAPILTPKIESFLENLPAVKSVTNQRVSGRVSTNNITLYKFRPDIEVMEGAALFYVCIKEGVPFLELRAISNMVGERDKSKWRISEAFASLKTVCQGLIDSIL